MTINLSEHAGGGDIAIYNPTMLYNDGTDYQELTVTQTGNGITFLGVITPETTYGRLLMIRETTGTATAGFEVWTIADGKLKIGVNDNVNASICDIQSDGVVDLTDGNRHAFKFEYNASTGYVSLIIDGEDADDLAWVSRSVTTGTLSNDAGTILHYLEYYNHTNIYIGGIAFSALAFNTGYAWSDFFDEYNQPIEMDEITWTPFNGTAPIAFNPNGDWSDNRGSGGNATVTGVFSAQCPPENVILPATLGLPTVGDAVAADIMADKVAWVDGVRIVGTRPTYDPGMMTFNGTDAYYSITSHPFLNQANTTVIRFKRSSFTGGTSEALILANSTNPRTQILVFPSDHATADLQNRMRVLVKNSSGTFICDIASNVDVMDGVEHIVFFSFNGATGDFTFTIDGVAADNPSYSGRVAPTSGTLDTSSTYLLLGSNSAGGSLFYGGEMGYVGYRSAYLTNYTDFMTGSTPIELDEITWSEWGSQPEFWNKYSLMELNKGSAGAMTKNGTIIGPD